MNNLTTEPAMGLSHPATQSGSLPGSRPIDVHIVDDDHGLLASLSLMLTAAGFSCATYSSGDDFLLRAAMNAPAVVLLDVRMPGTPGLDVLVRARVDNTRLGFIVMTGHADIPMAVRAMKLGSLDFFEKPFDAEALIARIGEVLARVRTPAASANAPAGLSRADVLNHPVAKRLSKAQLAVFPLLVEGLSEEEIGKRIFRSKHTVHDHAKAIYATVGARTRAQLIRALLGGPVDDDASLARTGLALPTSLSNSH
ncbi:MAG: response regulator transcription factor [Phycisphaerales bacterium]|jgi:two-component system response regulator FixJ|nr:response regulator [Phycisphaeraceae bacterium]